MATEREIDAVAQELWHQDYPNADRRDWGKLYTATQDRWRICARSVVAALDTVRAEPSPEPSDEACKAAFEHWYCAMGEKGWDAEDKSIQDDWREGMKKAHAIDSPARSTERAEPEDLSPVAEALAHGAAACEHVERQRDEAEAERDEARAEIVGLRGVLTTMAQFAADALAAAPSPPKEDKHDD